MKWRYVNHLTSFEMILEKVRENHQKTISVFRCFRAYVEAENTIPPRQASAIYGGNVIPSLKGRHDNPAMEYIFPTDRGSYLLLLGLGKVWGVFSVTRSRMQGSNTQFP